MPSKPPSEGFHRMTLDLPRPLHRNIKVTAATTGKSMGATMREVLEAAFGKPTKSTRRPEKVA